MSTPELNQNQIQKDNVFADWWDDVLTDSGQNPNKDYRRHKKLFSNTKTGPVIESNNKRSVSDQPTAWSLHDPCLEYGATPSLSSPGDYLGRCGLDQCSFRNPFLKCLGLGEGKGENLDRKYTQCGLKRAQRSSWKRVISDRTYAFLVLMVFWLNLIRSVLR